MSEKEGVEQRLARFERTLERSKRHAARTEYSLASGCVRCSGQCELDDHVWETWVWG